MINEIISKLNGTDDSFRKFSFPDKPSKIIVIGTLADKSKDFSSKGDDTRTLTTVRNNSLSIKFLVKKDQVGHIKVKPSCKVFFRIFPSLEENINCIEEDDYADEEVEMVKIWHRETCVFQGLSIDLSKDNQEHILDFNKIIEKINRNYNVCTSTKVKKEILESEETYNKFINSKAKKINFSWSAKIDVKRFLFNENLDLIEISFTNITDKNKSYETFIFDCNLSTELGNVILQPFKYNYEYDEQEYYFDSDTRCINCHAELNSSLNIIETKHYSLFQQEKVIPINEIAGVSLEFNILRNKEKSISELIKLKANLDDFLINYSGSDLKYKKRFAELIQRYGEGINTLEKNKTALKAFNLMNETFFKTIKKYKGWRTFQVIFIVSLIPDIIENDKQREICEVLHIPTGGGKSETYFGLVIFLAFWDRLIGKVFGTTAITKFPLRMLSVQQLQRIANLMIWAEEIRKKQEIQGQEFSVGYFVGKSDDFPRYTKMIIQKLKKAKQEGEDIPGMFLKVCPICEGEIILDFHSQNLHTYHKCKSCKREFLLFFSAEEIYRYIPTLIVSTVDKLAGIALNRRTKNIFGGKLDRCKAGHGFIPRGDSCEVSIDNTQCNSKSEQVNIDFSTSPSLVIQDEMHLIRESFGTIASHFESLLEALSSKIGSKRFKNIAMTATITGAQNQIKNLYHKQTRIFPPIPKDGRNKNDFFFKTDIQQDKTTVQRFLIGLKPNLRDNQFSSLLTSRYISEYIKKISEKQNYFKQKYNLSDQELDLILKNYKSILTYHGKKSDVHSMNYYLDTVVNSKLENYKIKSQILTGESTLDEIRKMIDLIQNYHNIEQNKESVLATFATSVVSHGVDIDRWNLMIFQGMPRNTAEYIQALSRVGRKYVGIVFIWFYPRRARDLSYYKNFYDYHSILEHKVEEVPISRWPKLGFYQTFTSVFNAAIMNYLSDDIEEPMYNIDAIKRIINDNSNTLKNKLIDFIKTAYISDSTMKGADFYRNSINYEVERRLKYLIEYDGVEKSFFPNALRDCDEMYFRTQFGMRGIQSEVILKPIGIDLDFIDMEENK